jgi:p-hydroxybenzoate 3-monooxygenase
VWQAEKFSWWFTMATHRLSDNPFDLRMQVAELEYITSEPTGQRYVAEQYVGLPITDPVTDALMAWE